MTVGDLISRLQDFDEECPVKLALQQNYPMIGSIYNICAWKKKSEDNEICLIACSDNEDYGCPREAWDSDYIDSEDDD